jgi:hypothetical protein
VFACNFSTGHLASCCRVIAALLVQASVQRNKSEEADMVKENTTQAT